MEQIPGPSGEKTRLGLEPNLAGSLCYLFQCLSGLVFFLIETENRRIRFHALQSLILFSLLCFLSFVSIVLAIFVNSDLFRMINALLALGNLILWLALIIQTYQGKTLMIPGISRFVSQTVGWPEKKDA